MSGPLSTFLRRFEEVNPAQTFNRKYFALNVTRFLSRSQAFKKANPRAPWALLGLSLLPLYGYLSAGLFEAQAKEEISFRKEQLVKPVYELSPDESVDFPWTDSKLKEWLYRPVKISGRPIHAKAKLVPRFKYGHKGFDYIVPLVTSENPDGSNQKGVLLNMGWMPFQWKQVSSRLRIENARRQTFVAYVSLNKELEHTLWTRGNAPDLARNKWNSVNLEAMAANSNFENQKEASWALLERIDLQTPLDERNMEHYSHDASYTQDYPHPKTMAGALQLREMPWDHESKKGLYWKSAGVLGFLGVGLLAI